MTDQTKDAMVADCIIRLLSAAPQERHDAGVMRLMSNAAKLLDRLARENERLREESLAPVLDAMTSHREELLAWVQQVYVTICGQSFPDAIVPDASIVTAKWKSVGEALLAAEARAERLAEALLAIPEMIEDSDDAGILAVVRTALATLSPKAEEK